jgi:lipopolysaccharide biosynthesis regulator YciM
MTLNLERTAAQTRAPASTRVEAGSRGAGEYRCSDCGYGIVTFALVPTCPMCHGASWEAASTGPFSARPAPSPED